MRYLESDPLPPTNKYWYIFINIEAIGSNGTVDDSEVSSSVCSLTRLNLRQY